MAVLYAARPQRSLNWSDSAVLRCHRFLTQVWEYSNAKLAELREAERESESGAGSDQEPAQDTSEHLRLRLEKWCEAAVERTTRDMEQLEMHSAVRNVMRFFDRIKDFEKRVLARDARLSRASLEALTSALTLLAQMLGPLAPHVAEELWIASGNDGQGARMPWPGVSSRVPA
jgi:leucyl-tRNA synthetase